MRLRVVFFTFFIYTYYMNKWIPAVAAVVLFPVLGYGQEETPAKVREDAFLIQKEIEVWRTDLAATSNVPVYSCQALRIHPNWLLTAAHCVYAACKDTLPCTVQVTLAEGELREQVRIYHTTAAKRVFIYEGFFPGQNRISSTDAALIKLDPAAADYSFEIWNADKSRWDKISASQFEKLLPSSPETKAQLNAAGARLVSAANISNARFLPQLVVPRMTQGSLSYLVEPVREVFFVRSLRHFISPGFGVQRGNSGGGVFTAQGDLVGLVSSLLYARDGSASFQNEEGKTVLTLKQASDYFLFTGFNGSTLNFIRNRVPGLRTIGAENGFIEPTDKDFAAIIKRINSTSMALE